MAGILVREAVGAADMAVVRVLLAAYGEYLAADHAGAAGICIQGYERELAGLPEPYAALLVAFVNDVAAGCVALKDLTDDKRHPGRLRDETALGGE